MKSINLISLVDAYHSLKAESYENFLDYYGIKFRPQEIEDLKDLIKILINDKNILNDLDKEKNIFNRFYVGYKIPQIEKEFDLLRFDDQSIINIELKSNNIDEDKILKQLRRNKYYLKDIKNKVHYFSFISNKKLLYYLNDDESLKEVEFSCLIELLNNQNTKNTEIIDDLFQPSDYLVSPFNSTEKFIQHEYFLTPHQEEIKNTIISSLNKTDLNFISVRGSAGTGKTLLIYDIVQSLQKNNKKPLIIHCGNLNDGQEKLRADGWEIIPIKNYKEDDLSNYDAIFIDEVQRIYLYQFQSIIAKITSTSRKCIFSYQDQTLSEQEKKNNIHSRIQSMNPISYKLTKKIRTNKEVATFIEMLFDKGKKLKLFNQDNIELNYFSSVKTAKHYFRSLNNDDWKILRFTGEFSHKKKLILPEESHKVIGQEFDGVAVAIDKYFTYKNDKLIYKKTTNWWSPKNMLYHNLTRAKKKINLVIINNEEVLNRCIKILSNQVVLQENDKHNK